MLIDLSEHALAELIEAFLHVLTGGAYGRQILSSFSHFWLILEVPVGTLLGQIVIKNRV